MRPIIRWLIPVLILTAGLPRPANAQPGLRYYLIFSARSGSLIPFSFGHAFVSWGRGQKDSLIANVGTYGFFPGRKSPVFNAVTEAETGDILKGYRKNSKGIRVKQLVVKVDSTTWQRTLNQAEGWQGSSYNLLYQNCVDFIDYIAKTAGLVTPKTYNLAYLPRNPVCYIQKLWRKNHKHAIRARTIRFKAEGVGPKAYYLGPKDYDDLSEQKIR